MLSRLCFKDIYYHIFHCMLRIFLKYLHFKSGGVKSWARIKNLWFLIWSAILCSLIWNSRQSPGPSVEWQEGDDFRSTDRIKINCLNHCVKTFLPTSYINAVFFREICVRDECHHLSPSPREILPDHSDEGLPLDCRVQHGRPFFKLLTQKGCAGVVFFTFFQKLARLGSRYYISCQGHRCHMAKLVNLSSLQGNWIVCMYGLSSRRAVSSLRDRELFLMTEPVWSFGWKLERGDRKIALLMRWGASLSFICTLRGKVTARGVGLEGGVSRARLEIWTHNIIRRRLPAGLTLKVPKCIHFQLQLLVIKLCEHIHVVTNHAHFSKVCLSHSKW